MTDQTARADLTADRSALIPAGIALPFILVTACFALWGFANDITNPMVKAFSKILLMSNFEGSLVQFAFYGGYFAMAFPAAMFIKKFSYKSGILMGLALYATGALLFIPASLTMVFWPFLVSYFILTCGLSFLETSANPYILSMGSEETATRRLNFSQSFNPIGSLLGMFIAQQLILARLDSAVRQAREAMDPEALHAVTAHDLGIIRGPYVGIGLFILVVLVVIAITKMPQTENHGDRLDMGPTMKRLFANRRYIEGVVAQFFYVGAQIMCWTFIIHYGTELFTAQGMAEQDAEVLSQKYNIVAMVIFCLSRFICTFLLRYFSPGRLLIEPGRRRLRADRGHDLHPGHRGAVLPGRDLGLHVADVPHDLRNRPPGPGRGRQVRRRRADHGHPRRLGPAAAAGRDHRPRSESASLSAVRASFVLPLICFVVIAIYGLRAYRTHATA